MNFIKLNQKKKWLLFNSAFELVFQTMWILLWYFFFYVYYKNWPCNSHEWPRQNFSLQYWYNVNQTSDENKENYQFGDN